MQRPQKIYREIFAAQGLPFQQDGQSLTISAALQSGDYTIRGDISSQFISGLLFTLPLVDGASTLHILPPFESRSYVKLTVQMLESFGIHVEFQDEHTLYIPGNQHYQPHDHTIEGDYSQFAFFAVLAAIQHDLTIRGVSFLSQQGDKHILSILQAFHADVEALENGYLIKKGHLQGADIDLADCPDLGPILCVLAMYAEGTTRIFHAGRLRIKESDRIAAMEEELRKFGVDITSTEDEIFIQGCKTPVCEQELYGHNDHRIVMALTIAGLCSRKAVVIEGAQAIQKSYPNFFADVQRLQGKVEEI